MKTFHNFKNAEAFEKFLRTRYENCTHGSGCLDYVTVGGILYTMHEYDMDGQTITWANKKHQLMLELTTRNRYKFGYRDAQVIEYEASYMRTDIAYAQ